MPIGRPWLACLALTVPLLAQAPGSPAPAPGQEASKPQDPFQIVALPRETTFVEEPSLLLSAAVGSGASVKDQNEMRRPGTPESKEKALGDMAEDKPNGMRCLAIPLDPGEKVVLRLKAKDPEKMYMRLAAPSKTDGMVPQVRRINSRPISSRRRQIDVTNETSAPCNVVLVILGNVNIPYRLDLERKPGK